MPEFATTEEFLEYHEIPFRKERDGSITVPGELYVASMGLTRLPDFSNVTVERGFTCAHNKLTSLAGSPKKVRGYYSCYGNELTSLEGATQDVGGNFACSENRLTTLKGAPTGMKKRFLCGKNPDLKSLEHAPQAAKDYATDFGFFKSWDEVPENLRISDETRAAQLALETTLRDNLVLRQPMPVKHAWKLRKKQAF
jgi:hypothetical protein